MKFQINVTKDVLIASQMCRRTGLVQGGIGNNCAVAQAICELFPNAWVTTNFITFIKDWSLVDKHTQFVYGKLDKSEIGRVELPWVASSFISKFDALAGLPEERIKLPEISFEIDVPDELLEKVVNIDDIHAILKESKTLQCI